MMLKHRKLRAVRRRRGGLELEVCWRDDKFGRGPCFSIYKHGREMLRFDLFERGAHWHSYREPMQPRHYFGRDGESFAPVDKTVDLSHLPPPPADVLMTKAIGIARKHYATITEDDDRWLQTELWARWAPPAR